MMRDNYELQRQAAARTFLTYDSAKIAQTFGLATDETALYFSMLRTPHRLLRETAQVERLQDGAWTPAGFDAAMTVYDLLTNPNGRPVLANEWCAHTSFHAVQGGTTSGSLMIRPEQSAQPFADDPERLRRACARLGGREVQDGDFASVLPAFECLPEPPASGCLPVPPASGCLPVPPASGCLPVLPASGCLPVLPASGCLPMPPASGCLPVPPASGCLPVPPASGCLPVLLRFWNADEEFPAQLQLLWDRNTCRYLRYETTFYLTGEILRRLREM